MKQQVKFGTLKRDIKSREQMADVLTLPGQDRDTIKISQYELDHSKDIQQVQDKICKDGS